MLGQCPMSHDKVRHSYRVKLLFKKIVRTFFRRERGGKGYNYADGITSKSRCLNYHDGIDKPIGMLQGGTKSYLPRHS